MWPVWTITILVFLHYIVLVTILIGPLATWLGYFKERKKVLKVYFWTITLVALSYITTGACVLTTLERYLRRTYAPESVYSEGFIAHTFKYFGVTVADITSFWIVTSLLVIGMLGLLYHHTNIRKVFAK